MTTQQSDACGYMISAPWRSSGKTLVSIGLAHEAYRRQLAVQTFKKGPDFIDPLWLASASGRPCYNLDPWFQQTDELKSAYWQHLPAGTLGLTEGTMGLHDGLCSDGTDSNAAIAKLLGQKVLLVVDCRGMHRTIAALINGLQQFDTDVQFAGVILNRIRSARHGSKVRTAIAEHTSLQVLGEIPETDSVHIAEKQLGLVPAPEFHNNTACIESIAAVVRDHVNVESLFSGVARAPQQTTGTPISAPAGTGNATLTIGIAKDEAFHFYYHDDLEALRNRGVTLREVSPLHDDFPADLDGLLIGGGFPERHAAALQSNAGFRQALKSAIEAGLPVHAECGGLMYLCNSLQIDKHSFAMVGIFDAEVAMLTKPVGRGYVRLRRLADNAVIAAHEFHHSKAHFNTPQPFTHMVERGYGIDGNHDGVSRYNAHASYAHVRHTQRTPWVDEFLALVQHSAYQQPANAGVAR